MKTVEELEIEARAALDAYSAEKEVCDARMNPFLVAYFKVKSELDRAKIRAEIEAEIRNEKPSCNCK